MVHREVPRTMKGQNGEKWIGIGRHRRHRIIKSIGGIGVTTRDGKQYTDVDGKDRVDDEEYRTVTE